jgi:tetratricopeptide (TPR) repeat protein
MLAAALALLLYLPTLYGGLVWDDPLILYHSLYRPPVDWGAVIRSPLVLSPNYYRPLAVASLVLLGDTAWAQHLVNALLHALNAGLVALLAVRLRLPRRAVWVPPLLYAVHPALVEGVSFIAGRFDLLLTTFLLLALLADQVLRERRVWRTLAVGGCVLLAALSKEMAAGFPIVLPLWHLATEEGERRQRWPRAWPVYAGTLGALLVYLGLRQAALGYLYVPEAGRSVPVGTPLQHALLTARALAGYAVIALWPFTTLRPLHYSVLPLPLNAATTWLALAVALGVAAGMVFWWRRESRSAALGLAGLLALGPVLQVLPLELGGGAFIAERFLVFPLALVALAVGIIVGRVRHVALRPALLLWAVAAAATVQLTVPHWHSDEALWTWAMRRAPQSAMPYTNLALVAINQGDPARGLALAEAALQRDPNEPNAHDHRGLALFHLGRYEEAEAAFARAAEIEPQNALYWSNRAGALREQGRLQDAERMLVDEALPRDPSLWVTHFNLGLVYLRADRPDRAAQALNNALALAPPREQGPIRRSLEQTRDPARWLRLSDLLLANNDAEGALRALDRARELGADSTDVAVGRSAALIALGRLDEAEALLQAALLSAPQDARLYNNLGLVARKRGDTETARSFFKRAVELAPDWDLPAQNLEKLKGG